VAAVKELEFRHMRDCPIEGELVDNRIDSDRIEHYLEQKVERDAETKKERFATITVAHCLECGELAYFPGNHMKQLRTLWKNRQLRKES
jgi:hypothetical protein